MVRREYEALGKICVTMVIPCVYNNNYYVCLSCPGVTESTSGGPDKKRQKMREYMQNYRRKRKVGGTTLVRMVVKVCCV